MIEEHAFPARLTPTERVALEWIRAGKEPTSAALEAVRTRGWAKRSVARARPRSWLRAKRLLPTTMMRTAAPGAHRGRAGDNQGNRDTPGGGNPRRQAGGRFDSRSRRNT
jgi:hypothetical protein